MMYSVSLQNYVPAPRFDGQPWASYRIDEAPAEEGPWVTIVSGALSPADTDPEDPQPRSFTFTTGMQAGWYRVTFVDASESEESPTVPVQNLPSAWLAWTPSIDQVARKIMSRTRDQYGNMVGTFTEATTPSATQVEDITRDIMTEMADVIGDDVPAELRDDAADVAAIRAAMQVELDFFSEQVNTGRSIYPQLHQQLEGDGKVPGALSRLQRQIEIYNRGGEVEATSEGAAMRASMGGFPCSDNWLGRRM